MQTEVIFRWKNNRYIDFLEIIITIAAAKMQGFINEIRTIRFILNDTNTVDNSTAVMLARFENEITLREITNCLESSNEITVIDNITQLLRNRWERIRHSGFSYTQQPLNLVNQFCLDLATELSPIPATEDEIDELEAGEGPYFLLMPSLEAHKDIFGSNIHNLRIHEFVLSDDQRLYIPITGCLTHAFESDTGHFEHLVSLDNQHYPELSPSERLRMSRHSTPVDECYRAITAYNNQRQHGDDLGVHLNALAIALRAGGAHGGRGGREYDSGALANEGLVAFTGYWDSLTTAQKELYFHEHPSLYETLGRLMRPNHVDYQEVSYCVELLAEALDPIIATCNQTERRTAALHEEVIAKKRQLTLAPEVEHYPSAWLAEAKPPKIWQQIFALPERSQQELFQHTPQRSALHYALKNDPLALPEYAHLLNDNFRAIATQSRFTNNDTALIIAARAGGVEAVEVLLRFVAELNINVANTNGETALAAAIKGGHGDIVDQLLNREAEILDYHGVNLLKLAIDLELDTEILQLLLNKAVTYPLTKQKAVLREINHGYNNIVMFVADRYPAQLTRLFETTNIQINHQEINRQGDTTLILAAKAGSDVAIDILLRLGANIMTRSTNGNSILHWAAHNGHINIISMLRQHRELFEVQDNLGNTALHLAIRAGHAAVVDALVENGADIRTKNIQQKNAIDLARSLHPELIQPLLLKTITLTTEQQRECLHTASNGLFNNVLIYTASNYPALLDPLLEVICQNKQLVSNNMLNSRNGLEDTPLILAAKAGCANAVVTLLHLGADIEASNYQEQTALHAATIAGHTDVVARLIENKARIEAQDISGNTALNLAVQHQRTTTLYFLLASTARCNFRNFAGENTFDIATRVCPALINPLLLKAILLAPDDQREFLLNREDGRYGSIVAYIADHRVELLEPLFEVMQQNNIVCSSDTLNIRRNAENITPLIRAAQAGQASRVRVLMQLGARVDIRDHNRDTALHHAIKGGHGDTLDVLLADDIHSITYRNYRHENAIDLATSSCHPQLIPSLLKKAITLPLVQQKEFLHNVSGGIYNSILDYAASKQYSVPDLLNICGKNRDDYVVARQQMNQFFNFDYHIQPIQAKAQEMQRKPGMAYHEAGLVADTLIAKLERARNIFLLSDDGINEKKTTFKNSCISAIAEARPVLEKHRDWGKVIGCFLLALITFPISLPLLAFGVFSLKTNSAQKLHVLEREIEEALPSPAA